MTTLHINITYWNSKTRILIKRNNSNPLSKLQNTGSFNQDFEDAIDESIYSHKKEDIILSLQMQTSCEERTDNDLDISLI